jgi:hypothetical protein
MEGTIIPPLRSRVRDQRTRHFGLSPRYFALTRHFGRPLLSLDVILVFIFISFQG